MSDSPMGHLRIIFQVALRYLFGKRNRRYMSSLFTLIGISVGCVAMFVVIGVMNGLQQGYLEDIIEVQSYELQFYPEEEQYEQLLTLLEADPRVRSVTSFIDTQGLVEAGGANPIPCIIRGLSNTGSIDEGFLERTGLSEEQLQNIFQSRSVLMSRSMARMTMGSASREVSILMMGEGKLVRHVPMSVELSVAGYYHTGFPEIDSALLFTDLSLLRESNRNAVPHVGVKLYDYQRDAEDLREMANERLQVSSESWKEMNMAFYSALMLEKYAMMLLLSLIFLMVLFNAKASFEKYIFYKKDEIGMLRALGSGSRDIYGIFMLQGVLITITAVLIGSVLGYFSAIHINEIVGAAGSLISLIAARPVSLLVMRLPVDLSLKEILCIDGAIILLSLLQIYSSTRLLVRKTPLEILSE